MVAKDAKQRDEGRTRSVELQQTKRLPAAVAAAAVRVVAR
jgi:hypothetical protein